MKINVFEGARRISIALGALWIGGFLVAAAISKPYVSVTYRISAFGMKPLKVEDCEVSDVKAYESAQTSLGDEVGLNLCLGTTKSDNGDEMLVPYAPAENGKVWLGASYSSGVSQYTKRLANDFDSSAKVADEVRSLKWERRMAEWRDGGAVMCGGLFVGWLLVVAIGWVVRGFMGIPHGKDIAG